MNFPRFAALGGISRRIYAAFLIAAVVPTALAGAIGVYLSLQALKTETLRNLEQEVTVRSQGVGRFFDQLSSELFYLANARGLVDVVSATQTRDVWLLQAATKRLERDYAALASLYPHIYQIRLIAADGREWVRVDRKPNGVYVVPPDELQPKGDRYYFRDAMDVKLGQIYVSPLDLNVEFGKVEKPERPVIRVATPVAGPNGSKIGVLIINLHADILLEQIQQMATARKGTAYLFDITSVDQLVENPVPFQWNRLKTSAKSFRQVSPRTWSRTAPHRISVRVGLLPTHRSTTRHLLLLKTQKASGV